MIEFREQNLTCARIAHYRHEAAKIHNLRLGKFKLFHDFRKADSIRWKSFTDGTAGSSSSFNEHIRRRQIDDEGHVTVQAVLVRVVP